MGLLRSLAHAWAVHMERKVAEAEEQETEEAGREAERQARELAREKLKRVEGQMARGTAGDASEEQARDALRGRGGRTNKLDDLSF